MTKKTMTNRILTNEIIDKTRQDIDDIKAETFDDLRKGGDGCGYRVVNKAKHNIDDILNSPNPHIPVIYNVTI